MATAEELRGTSREAIDVQRDPHTKASFEALAGTLEHALRHLPGGTSYIKEEVTSSTRQAWIDRYDKAVLQVQTAAAVDLLQLRIGELSFKRRRRNAKEASTMNNVTEKDVSFIDV